MEKGRRRCGRVGQRRREKSKGKIGEGLRSQDVAVQVPSALAGLTAGFEKEPGGPPPHNTPIKHALLFSLLPCPPPRWCQGLHEIMPEENRPSREDSAT